MRTFLFIAWMLLSVCRLGAQEYETLSFESNYTEGKTVVMPKHDSKLKRTSCLRGGTIVYTVEGNMPDSLKTALETAASM